MAAVSEDNDLTFRNVCGGIKLLFKGTGRIASIKIEGKNGVWAKALGSSSDFHHSCNNTDKGMNFSGKFGDDTRIWYPLVPERGYSDGALSSAGYYAGYWSSSSTIYSPYSFYMHYWGEVWPSSTYAQANGLSVRCVQE